ncbi:phospholipase A2-like [Peromyscus leucopus]|uniref:phospholipase A2-like n=1 Tax=Peromyscus leucopus TaxID=10041 RepID=UPI0018850A74|nr:phospholipase A2-like [Peromyscus leucopus]
MKLLLLVTLLTGATTSRISTRAGWKFGNLFQCTLPGILFFPGYNYYGCCCNILCRNNRVKDRCCQTRDNCYAQVKKLESCKFLIDDPQRSLYTYLCSGNKVTCSEENSACEDLICNCDRQATICFSKENKGIQC